MPCGSQKTGCTSSGSSEQVTETSVPMLPFERLSRGNYVPASMFCSGGELKKIPAAVISLRTSSAVISLRSF